MAWITLTTDDLATRLTGAELAAARTVALAAGQSDPAAEVLIEVTREVRSYVAGNEWNTLAPGETVPDECKGAALDRAVFQLAKRLPGRILVKPGEARDTANRDAVAFLRDVAAKRVRIVQPLTATTEHVAGQATQLVRRRKDLASRQGLEGL